MLEETEKVDWITAPERRLSRRWIAGVATLFCAIAFVVITARFYTRKFYATTGEAQWIWASHQMSAKKPIVFFAAKTFDLPERRSFIRINVACDPEYTLFFNGHEIGGARFEETRSLDVYDVTPLAREKGNRIVVATRSANGVGGLIASVDFADDVRNLVVTSGDWKLYSSWSPQLGDRDLPLPQRPIAVLGRPPIGRWDYLPRQTRTTGRDVWVERHAQPPQSFRVKLPKVEVKSGVAVTAYESVDAVAYDFGHVEGRTRVTRRIAQVDEVIRVRFANAPEELQAEGRVESIAFAKGERVVTEPATRRFRYVIVYESDAVASVLQRRTELKIEN